jgi:ATP-dependent helicase HrpA
LDLIPTYPPSLPVSARKDEIVAALRQNRVVVIAGETGSGKTTQIPKMCLEAGLAAHGRIACTQPRRVAALSVSRRIAEELKVRWGREVGCKIRFSDQTSRDTVIKMMTDGMLLAEAQSDPSLSEYGCIIIDEAHERSLNIDFLLGHLLTLLARREDLKIVITSATIDTKAFSAAFGNAPIIEVSGRLFPVETIYLPLDHVREEAGDTSYVDAAVSAVELALDDPVAGDVLIFMPGERDIRETRDFLEGRHGGSVEIIPLFGRLSAAEQERVFAASNRRKIVIATNIAETSLTIPGIRYVIDTGLARVSRYSPRTRTRRLPIEPISQSSANQRKGRAGRVANGICIRLYSEEEFNERPQFSQPEIQRANLAEVILRMMTFNLGEIENFPFINPPTPASINAGYQLLQELGALNRKNQITEIGRALGRLPVDPTIGRMILQAQQENCLPEILVIAAGLSIQDPRERPMDQKDAATNAHKKFEDPSSDFLTLLKIWNAYHEKWDALKTQNQLRRFCRDHFLNYMRMREWREIYTQLEEAVAEKDQSPIASAATIRDPNQRYRAVHRAILTGLLGHVADKTDRNIYRASANRQVMIFPGSAMFDRSPPRSKKNPNDRSAKTPNNQPTWIVAGEIVETSRLYARTVAGVEPQWIVELGAHVCKIDYREPAWDRKAGRVLVKERALLHGLELQNRRVGYAQINPPDATNIFILSALVEDEIDVSHAFLEHNRGIRQKIETWQTRMRHADLPDLDRAFFKFYADRIKNVSSTPDLNRLVKDQGQDFLKATEKDIVGDRALSVNEAAFPEKLRLGDKEIPLQYAYAPGEEHDGVTVQVPLSVAHRVPSGLLEWAVPGYREEQIQHLLRGLPKTLRVPLMPLEPKAKEIATELQVRDHSFLEALSKFVHKRYGQEIPIEAWDWHSLPSHLRPRIEVVGPDQKVIAVTKNFSEVQTKLEQCHATLKTSHWENAARTHEKFDLRSWNFGDIAEELQIGGGLVAFPGLELDADNHVNLRLFKTPREARIRSQRAVPRLAELGLQKELAWVEKDLRGLNKVAALYLPLGSAEELVATALAAVRRYIFAQEIWPLRESAFNNQVEEAQAKIAGLTFPLMDSIGSILRQRHELALHKKPYRGMQKDLGVLVPKRFLDYTPWDQIPELPRYLKAMSIRAERAAVNPAKDQERQKQIQPYVDAWQKWAAEKPTDPPELALLREFRWLVEEFKVSLFAQELGTKKPVSARRLEELLRSHRGNPR